MNSTRVLVAACVLLVSCAGAAPALWPLPRKVSLSGSTGQSTAHHTHQTNNTHPTPLQQRCRQLLLSPPRVHLHRRLPSWSVRLRATRRCFFARVRRLRLLEASIHCTSPLPVLSSRSPCTQTNRMLSLWVRPMYKAVQSLCLVRFVSWRHSRSWWMLTHSQSPWCALARIIFWKLWWLKCVCVCTHGDKRRPLSLSLTHTHTLA